MNPLMPKGVEHVIIYNRWKTQMTVMNPLMPKGVEHISKKNMTFLDELSDEPSDAERR